MPPIKRPQLLRTCGLLPSPAAEAPHQAAPARDLPVHRLLVCSAKVTAAARAADAAQVAADAGATAAIAGVSTTAALAACEVVCLTERCMTRIAGPMV